MPRQVNKPVPVTLVHDDDWDAMRPSSFTYRGGRYVVQEVIDRWDETGRWWEQDIPITVWRVLCRDGGVYELGMAHKQPPEWRLLAIHD